MDRIVHCARCYKAVSWEWCSDWYSHIKVKYCDECREIVRREQALERVHRYRARKKIADQEMKDRLKQLEAENKALRKCLNEQWGDDIDGTERGLPSG